MSFLRKRRVQHRKGNARPEPGVPSGRPTTGQADRPQSPAAHPTPPPPSLQCDRCGETFPCSRPFVLDGAGCIRCDDGRVHPTEHLEDLLRVEVEAGVNQLQAWLREAGL